MANLHCLNKLFTFSFYIIRSIKIISSFEHKKLKTFYKLKTPTTTRNKKIKEVLKNKALLHCMDTFLGVTIWSLIMLKLMSETFYTCYTFYHL